MLCKKIAVLVISAFLSVLLPFGKAVYSSEEITGFIRNYIDQARFSETLWIGCEKIHAGKNLVEFYENRSFSPVWVGSEGILPHSADLKDALSDAGIHGLLQEDYHFTCINEWIATLENRSENSISHDMKELAGFDIVMTDAFLTFGSHLADGKVDPESIYPQWVSAKIKTDVFSALNHISEGLNVHKALKQLAPPYSDYWNLLHAAKWFQELKINGGWPVISEGKAIRLGDNDSRISGLKKRLGIGGYLSADIKSDDNIFDLTLERAVRNFQKNHGLDPDGVVGKNTIAELNISAEKRQAQILVNLERWRWLPRHLGQRHIRVNIAAFSLEAVNHEDIQLDMRVIVGKDYQKTPVFSQQIRYLEFNPYWNVPRDIVREEILPKIIKNPNYLVANKYEIVRGWDENSPVIDPSTIDWSTIHAGNFPGRVRQTPGPWNSLGRIKFMFPNKFNVYLHDTSEKNLFQKSNRALSHGCIRLEKPFELALFLFQDEPGWTRERIEKIIKNKKRMAVPVPGFCMVHLLYFTSWIDQNGQVQFRKDIYQRDHLLWEALNRIPDINAGKDGDHLAVEKAHG